MKTKEIQATLTVQATPPQVVIVPSATPATGLTATVTPASAKTPAQTVQPTRAAGCNLAAAGRPIDVTIPDNTRLHPGDAFLKIWRLVNAGSCSWTKGYSVIWFSGENLASRKEQPFREEVLPGQSIDLSIDMLAPQETGLYQSNWKLRDENGELFGIGPNAASPFWVRVEVIAAEELALSPFSTRTAIPGIYSSGNAVLMIGQPYDLDEVLAGPSAGDDIFLRLTNDMIEIVPLNGSRLATGGSKAPGLADCRESVTLNSPLILASELINTYLCVRTDKGLPASMYLARVDASAGTVGIRFTVWTNP